MNLNKVTRIIVGPPIIVAVAIGLAACASPAAPSASTNAPTPVAAAPTAALASADLTTEATPTAAPTAAPTTSAAAKPTVVPKPIAAAVAGEQLVLLVDTVRGPVGLTNDEKAYLTCVQENRFPQGADVVFRVRVMDTTGGKAMDNKQLKSVTLTLPDGTTKALKYGDHGGKDAFWTTSYVIPATYPTGAFDYKIDAVDNSGRTGSSFQFNVANALMQIVPAGQR